MTSVYVVLLILCMTVQVFEWLHLKDNKSFDWILQKRAMEKLWLYITGTPKKNYILKTWSKCSNIQQSTVLFCSISLKSGWWGGNRSSNNVVSKYDISINLYKCPALSMILCIYPSKADLNYFKCKVTFSTLNSSNWVPKKPNIILWVMTLPKAINTVCVPLI